MKLIEIYLIGVQIEIYLFWCSCLNSVHTARRAPVIIKNTIPAAHTHTQLFSLFGSFVRPVSDRRRILLFQVEGRGVGDTHITGRHFGGDTHITSDMCVGIHISRGYTYHCDRLQPDSGYELGTRLSMVNELRD